MDLLATIEEELTGLRGSGALTTALETWKGRREGLRSFRDAETLIAFLRDPQVRPRRRKDAALAALCVEANRGEQRAATLLLWLLLPGLLRVRHRLAGRGVLGDEELDAELLAGMWGAATKVRAETQHVATRLLNGARWRALGAIREAIECAKRSEPLGPEFADIPEPEVRAGGRPAILAGAIREGVVSVGEAELILASRRTIREVGSQLGVTLCAAQNRRLRAKRRLIAWLGESQMSSLLLAQRPPRNLSQNSQGSPDHDRPPRPPL
jgi:hypothetical protein